MTTLSSLVSSTVVVSNNTTTPSTQYPMMAGTAAGSTTVTVSDTKLSFNPQSGTLSATTFNSTSDAAKKTNIQDADGSLIAQLRGIEFDWVDTGAHSAGVIAQEVQSVLPHLVDQTESGLSVNYSGLTAYLIEAVKRLQQEVDTLKLLKWGG